MKQRSVKYGKEKSTPFIKTLFTTLENQLPLYFAASRAIANQGCEGVCLVGGQGTWKRQVKEEDLVRTSGVCLGGRGKCSKKNPKAYYEGR